MRYLTLLSILTLILGGSLVHAKTGSLIVTAQMRANAMRNCERYEWARQYRDSLIAQVKPYVEMSDDELWQLLPSQDMPRDSSVNRDGAGCPKCGKDHFKGNYNDPWEVDRTGHPWQVRCTYCKEWFPKNDFAAYYQSALDEQHKFRLGKGAPQFLKPKEEGPFAECVDDGTGYVKEGHQWFFAAGYAFRLWFEIVGMYGQGSVLERLAILYTLTDDPRYAHKAGVLLDRIADLYPEMDYTPHYRLGMEASTGGSGKGRALGCIWETWTAQNVSRAYDYTYDTLLQDKELLALSQRMAAQYHTGDKSSLPAIATHIEDHALVEFIKGVQDHRIWGNPGMEQESMAATAIALDRPGVTEQALDWLFQPDLGQPPYGGGIPGILVETLSREGFSDEAGLGYASIPAQSFRAVADLLERYPAYAKHNLYRDYPKFRNCFTMCGKVRALDRYSPNIGDSDKCMNIGAVGLTMPVEMELAGYRAYGGADIAREVWFANGKKLDGLRLDVYDAEPEAILAKLKADLAADPGPLRSFNTGGYGLAVLQAPQREAGRALLMYYGRMGGHGHEDRLQLGLVAHDCVMAPDMGYPQYTGYWPPRIGWDSHNISHNTCMVNDKGFNRESWSGKTRLFEQAGPIRVVDVDGGKVHDNVTTFRRCAVMVDVDEASSYMLDLFWVRGGKNHRLIQNGGGPEVTTSDLQLTPQDKGTYAGENVALGEFYDGPKDWTYDGSGFMYLDRVQKGGPAGDFWVDWKIVEPRRKMPDDWEAHLRVHNLTAVDEAALCTGYPPAYKGNPPQLRYLLRTRFGEDLRTQFVSVLEPYGKSPLITGVRLLKSEETPEGFRAAVEVKLADGRRDVVLATENGGKVEAGGVSLEGRLGFVRFDAAPLAQVLIAGRSLVAGKCRLALPAPFLTGKLLGWDDTDPARTLLKVEGTLPTKGLAGKYLMMDNTERSDASYLIQDVPAAGRISIGCNSLVERFVNSKDYSQGVVYNVAPGQTWRIANSATWQRK